MDKQISRRNDLLPGHIRGISRTSLWKSWHAIRRDLKRSSVRDVVDYLDFDVNPDVWINRLLLRIRKGEYEPEAPTRFTLGKSNGLSRTMTLPSVPDLVLYRTIIDYLYARVHGKRHRNVYFLQDELSKLQNEALADGKQKMDQASDFETADSGSAFTGKRSFLNWLRFDQYRKHLLYEETYNFIVVTDVANFFDTILHSHLDEATQTLSLPPRMIGLLFFLLERLSIRQDYSSSHEIGLPTDQFDCSRTLAHLVLFPHDDAMVRLVGEDRYVRWMDDQSIAVDSKAEGLRALREVGRSLARLHLTPNSGKTKVLSLEEARRHYHLDLNKAIDEAEVLAGKAKSSSSAQKRFATKVRGIWRDAKQYEGIGEFSKILKRVYRLAGLAKLTMLRKRAIRDVLSDPSLIERVSSYYRCTGTVAEYLDFVESLLSHPEQVYPDVNVALSESLLRMEPNAEERKTIRKFAKRLVDRKTDLHGGEAVFAAVALLVLRFGDKPLFQFLKRWLTNDRRAHKRVIVRSAGTVYSSRGRKEFEEVHEVASTLLRNHLSSLVRLITEIRKYEEVPKRYNERLSLRLDSVAGVKFVDMRAILTARLLMLNEHAKVQKWVMDWRQKMIESAISDYDRQLLRRLVK